MNYDVIHGNWDSFVGDNVGYDLVYIDPPFYTQKTHSMLRDGVEVGFEDRWDSFEQYMEWLLGVVETCWDGLVKSGTLYSHNNFEINAHLLSKLPEHISKNFVTNISWVRSHPHNNLRKSWGNIVDSIMMLSKTRTFYFKVQYGELDEAYKSNSFNNEDPVGRYALTPITGEKSRVGYDFEYNGIRPKYGWRYKADKIVELDSQNLIHWGKNKPYRKMYVSESKGRPIQNFWNDVYPITRTEENKRHYPTQKPVKLLNRIIQSSCPMGGSILDPFAGSGTTLLAGIQSGIPGYVKVIDNNPDAIALIHNSIPKYREFFR